MTSFTCVKTKFAASAVAFALMSLCVSSASASVDNGSFESGLANWTVFQTASTSAPATAGASSALIQATNGGPVNAAALESFVGVSNTALQAIKSGYTNLTTGSAIKQTFFAEAGSTLKFD